MANIRVLITSDICFFAEGLAQLLAGFPNLQVVGWATGPAEARELVRDQRPDVVLIDVGMEQAIALLHDLDGLSPNCRKVAVAIRDDEAAVLQWAEAGIAGFVTRASSGADVAQMIEGVSCGELRCTPRMAAQLLDRIGKLAADRTPNQFQDALTVREREVARLVEQGLSNKEIARQLFIALPTVKNHIHRIFEKLDVKHRNEAAASFRRQRLGGRLVT